MLSRTGIAAVGIFWGIIGGAGVLAYSLERWPNYAPYVGIVALVGMVLGLSALIYHAVAD